MADLHSSVRLKHDVPEWNEWRKDDPDYRSKLSTSPIRNTDPTRKIDFEALELQNADRLNADFRNANLKDINLLNADLQTAMLQNADLLNASLRNANLLGVKVLYDTFMESPLSKERFHEPPRRPPNKFDYTGDVIWVSNWKKEQEGSGKEFTLSKPHTHQTIHTVTPIGEGLSLSSIFVRLPREVSGRNEPLQLEALANMKETRILVPEVKSFEEMAEHLTPEGVDSETFTEALRKALVEDCAVIAIRNPPFNVGKDWVDNAFTGGTIFTAIAHAPDPQTFVYFVVMAGAGFVTLRICKSLVDGADIIIRAKANQIANQILPPPTEQTKAKGKKKPKK